MNPQHVKLLFAKRFFKMGIGVSSEAAFGQR
jgi:hypothetical protein